MFWFISIINSGKPKSENTLRVEINQFCDGKRDIIRSSYKIDKICGLSYPAHFLKSRGSVIRNNFLEYRTTKATHFARRNDFYVLFGYK